MAVHRSVACRLAAGTWSCHVVRLTLPCVVVTRASVFSLCKRLESSTGGGGSGGITVPLTPTSSQLQQHGWLHQLELLATEGAAALVPQGKINILV